MKPLTEVTKTMSMATYLISASGNGTGILGDGGSTSGAGITEAGGKVRGSRTSDDDFGDLW